MTGFRYEIAVQTVRGANGYRRPIHRPADRFPDADELDRALAACRGLVAWTESNASRWWERRTSDPGHDRSALMPTVDSGAAGMTVEATGR
jgi:hypothetical protein